VKPEDDSIMIEDIEPLEEEAVPIINVGGMEPVFAVRETDEELQLEEVDESLPEESVSIEDERPPNLVNLLKDQELYEENPALQMFEPQPQLPSQLPRGQQQGPAAMAAPAALVPFPAQAFQIQAPLPPQPVPPPQPPQQSQLSLSPQTESLIANSLKDSAAAQAKIVDKLIDEMKTLSRKVDERNQNPPPAPPVIVHMPRPEIIQAAQSPLMPITMDLPAAAPRAEGLPRYAPADLEDEEPEPQPRRRRSDFAPSRMPEQQEPSQAAGSGLEPFAVSEAEPEIEWDPEPVSLEPEPEAPPGPPPAQPSLDRPQSPQPSLAEPPLEQPLSPRARLEQPPSLQRSYQPRAQRPAAQAVRPQPAPYARPAPAQGTRPVRSAPKRSAPAAEIPEPRRPAAPPQPKAPEPRVPRAPLPAAAPLPEAPAAPSEEPEEEPPPTAEQLPTSEPDKPARTGEDVRQELRDYLNGVRGKLDKGAAPSKPGDLLDYLGKLSDYLPDRDKKRFRGSNERLAMESLKAQLAGKKGLRQKIAESFRPVVPHRKEPMTRSLIVDTFSYLKDLSAWHPDKAIAAAMRERIESIVVQMGSLR